MSSDERSFFATVGGIGRTGGMDTRSIAARPDVSIATTTARVTPTPPRAAKFGEVLSQTVVRSAETAMSLLPGSPMMALAVRGATGATAAAGVPLTGTGFSAAGGATPKAALAGGAMGGAFAGGAAHTAVGGVGSALPGTSATGAANGANGASGAGPDGTGVESSLQQSQEMNLYFLQVQETVNQQNRTFTTFSNVLKAQHDTVKTAIGNIR